jgi:hypothetical protein
MFGKPLAIFAIILSLAVFLPNPVFAQAPGPTCPSGMNQYKNTGMCARPEAVSFCSGKLVGDFCSIPVINALINPGTCAGLITGVQLQNNINPGFTGWCLEQLSNNLNSAGFCDVGQLSRITLIVLIPWGLDSTITNFLVSTCKSAVQGLYDQFPGLKLVQGAINPVYSPDCGSDNSGVKTGLGCLSTNPQILVNSILPWAVGIGSGIAFLLGLYGALMIVISAGDPEKMQAGKEMITSAISGLLIIIFAVFILKFIGVDILQLFATPLGGVD